MKRQIIYVTLMVALAVVSVTRAHAQAREQGVSEERIRRLTAPDDTEKPRLLFSPAAVSRVQMRSVDLKPVVSPNSPQELRALIFENYNPPGATGNVRPAAAGPQVLRASGAEKLPSELSPEETTETMNKETSTAQKPPTQGNAEEEQQID